MNTKKAQTNRAVSILKRLCRDWRHMLPGAALAGAMAAANSALAMGDGLSPGLFPLPQEVGDRALLACPTDEYNRLNGCNAQGEEYLAIPGAHASDLFWNNGITVEKDVFVQGMQEVIIVGKEKAGLSIDQVCVAERGNQDCFDIIPGDDTSAPSCGSAVKVVSGSKFCKEVVLPELVTGYVINGLGYVIDVDLSSANESGRTTIWKCEGFTHRCVPDRDNLVIRGLRGAPAIVTPHSVDGYIHCHTPC